MEDTAMRSGSYPLIDDGLYKMLLVDDEEVVRHGLRYMLDWKTLGFRIANDVGSTAEALHLLESNHYDVLLTDIQMPGRNGLELIAEIRKCSPGTKIVVLSGYDSFEYAVTAMRHGVEDYLLKPFSRERAQLVFSKLADKLTQEKQQQTQHSASAQLAVSHFLYHLVQNDYRSTERIMDLENALGLVFPLRMILVNFCFKNYAEYIASHWNGNSHALFSCVYKTMKEALSADFDMISCQIGNNCIFVVPQMEQQQAEELLAQQADTLLHECAIGVSESVENIWELSIAYCQTIEALNQAQRTVNFYSGSVPSAYTLNSRLLACQNGILHCLECGRAEQLPELTQKVFEILRNQSVNYIYNWCLNSIHTAIEYFDIEKEKTGRINYHLFLDSTVHDDLITMLRTFYEEQLKEILRILQRLANNPNKQMIEKACAIIYHQYAESSFSLNAVADEINISYGYLCTIFKQVTGERFMDYLLRVRMQNAKRLLLEGGYKIYESAQQTGYNSARYFTLTFRKYYGMTPSEYTKKYGGKNEKI